MEIKKLCSRLTTLKIIDEDLIPEGVLDDRQEGNSFHRLYLSGKNEFNKIDEKLSEIDATIESMYEPTRKIYLIKDNDVSDEEFEPYSNFLFHYRSVVSTMLQFWLGQINTTIQYENSSQQLYTRIIQLMQKLNLQYYNLADSKQYYQSYLDDKISVLLDVKYELPSPDKRNIIGVALVDDLIDRIWRFEKQFATVD